MSTKTICINQITGKVTNHGNSDINSLHGSLEIRGVTHGWTVTDVLDGRFNVVRNGSVLVSYATIED